MCFTRCSHVLTWCSHVFPDSESIYFILLLYLEYPKPRIIKDHPQSFQITTSRKGLALRFGGSMSMQILGKCIGCTVVLSPCAEAQQPETAHPQQPLLHRLEDLEGNSHPECETNVKLKQLKLD